MNLAKRMLEVKGVTVARNDLIMRSTPLGEFRNYLLKLTPMDDGWELIRLGGAGDGGYLVPNNLDGIEICLSPGVDMLWKFESQLWEMFGIRSVLCDRIEKKPLDLPDSFSYFPLWLGPSSDDGTISLNDLIRESKASDSRDLILQMDIEGAEWNVLLATSKANLNKFRIVVLEVHNLARFKNRLMWQNVYRPVLDKLLETFNVVHVHPNNRAGTFTFGDVTFPNIIELTLHRKSESTKALKSRLLPNALDENNAINYDPIEIDWTKLL